MNQIQALANNYDKARRNLVVALSRESTMEIWAPAFRIDPSKRDWKRAAKAVIDNAEAAQLKIMVDMVSEFLDLHEDQLR